MKKTLILLPLVALLLAGCNGDNNDGPLPPPIVVDPNNEQLSGQPEDGDIIKIIHMNDTHGAIEYLPDANEPGMARVAGYVNAKRAEADTNVVLVSSGDMFQGSLDSNINQGKLMIDIMKEMRFDSMSIGNHEFDWGPDVLSENAAYAMNLEEGDWAFPFLSGNILNPEGQYDFGYLSTTFNRGGARVSIIGSIDSGVYNSIDAAVVEGYSFVNAANMVIAEAERLREAGSDIIIYSTHDVDKKVDSRIALYVDAVFTGHNHHNSVATMEGADSKVVPIIESSNNGKALGEVDFVYDIDSGTYQLNLYRNTIPLNVEPVVEDEGVKAIYDSYLDAPVQDGPISSDSLRALKTDKIGEITSESEFAGGDEISKSNVRKMFIFAQLEAYIDEYNVIASSYNEARSSWLVGDITYSDIYKAFPFDNATIIVEATGAQIRKWNTAMEFADDEVSKWTLNSTEMYRVVTSSYVINNNEVYNYTSVVHTDENLFQRHVFYQEFVKATEPNPWG